MYIIVNPYKDVINMDNIAWVEIRGETELCFCRDDENSMRYEFDSENLAHEMLDKIHEGIIKKSRYVEIDV